MLKTFHTHCAALAKSDCILARKQDKSALPDGSACCRVLFAWLWVFLCRFFSDFYSICGGHPGLDWVSWVGLPRGQARPARYCLPGAQESSKFSARNLSLHLCMSTPSGTHPQPLHVHIYTDTRLDPGNDRQLSRVQQPLKFGQNLNCSPRKASFAGKILNSTYKVLVIMLAMASRGSRLFSISASALQGSLHFS